jgi:FeS assembly SUF system protein
MNEKSAQRMEPATPGAAVSPADDSLEARIIAAMRTVSDPEIPVNIYDLGLIYGLDINAGGEVSVRMTLTAPGCPVAGILPEQVASAIRAVDGVTAAQVERVWDPPWCQECMSDEARLTLGLF